MVEKGKVLNALNVKLKGKSISKTFKENIAAKWAEKIDNETDIEDYINDREDIFTEAIAEADRRATDAVNKSKAPKDPPTPETTKDVDLPDDAPPYMRTFMDQLKEIKTDFTQYKAGQQQQTIAERFNSDPRLKNIPDWMKTGFIPTKDEDFETQATGLLEKFTEFSTKNNLNVLGGDAPGNTGGGNGDAAGKNKVDADLVKFAQAKNTEATKEK